MQLVGSICLPKGELTELVSGKEYTGNTLIYLNLFMFPPPTDSTKLEHSRGRAISAIIGLDSVQDSRDREEKNSPSLKDLYPQMSTP